MSAPNRVELSGKHIELHNLLLDELLRRMARDKACDKCKCLPLTASELEAIRKFLSDNRVLAVGFAGKVLPLTRNLPTFDDDDARHPESDAKSA